MRISDWSSDVCSSDLGAILDLPARPGLEVRLGRTSQPIAGARHEHENGCNTTNWVRCTRYRSFNEAVATTWCWPLVLSRCRSKRVSLLREKVSGPKTGDRIGKQRNGAN